MKLIWHIVKKDLRNSRWLLVAWLVVIGLQVALGVWALNGDTAFFEARATINPANTVLIGLQVIITLFFVAGIVQEDSLVETNAHWLTLPVSGAQLMAAKLISLALIGWILPAVMLWPWWLVNHWGMADVLLGTVELILLGAVVTLPALLVAVMTSNWTRFLTWMIVFAITLVFGAFLLMAQYSPYAPIPSGTLVASRAVAGVFVILFLLVTAVVVIQYLTRNRRYSVTCVGATVIAVTLILNFWPADFVLEVLKPIPLPLAKVQMHLESISGSAERSRNYMVGVDVQGDFVGLNPAETVIGQLRNVEWSWPDGVVQKPERNAGLMIFSSAGDRNNQFRPSELFPKQDNIFSLGIAFLTSGAARMLAEPPAFKARAEMVVRRREAVAEVAPNVGVTFGQGAHRFAIVESDRSEETLWLRMIETMPAIPWSDWRESLGGPLEFTQRSFVFFNRTKREVPATVGRQAQIARQGTRELGPFAGVLVASRDFQVRAPREYFSDRLNNERYGPFDPHWLDEVAMIFVQSRPVSSFASDVSEPHFVVRDRPASRNPPPLR